MELLLNLLWLLLALPAYRLWRDARDSRKNGSTTGMQCLLALGCMLVLLFPVVSATDDLHAMRPEMEESGKRSLRHAVSDRSSAAQNRWHNPIIAVAIFAGLLSVNRVWRELLIPQLSYSSTSFVVRPGRAPPAAVLA